MSDWFEVVYRFTDARGDREMIIYVGPLQACGDYVAENNNDDLIIRLVSF